MRSAVTIVVGGGVVGISTASALLQHGRQVLLIDKREAPGLETSFANGGLLTPSMAQPWNSPGCWRVLVQSLFSSSTPLKISMSTLPTLLGWGSQFLLNSRQSKYLANTRANLGLAIYSLEVMHRLRDQLAIEYEGAGKGTLRIFRRRQHFQNELRNAGRLLGGRLPFEALTQSETIALEPTLSEIGAGLVGSIYYPQDESGNAKLFCGSMFDAASRFGLEARFDTAVTGLAVEGGQLVGVRTQYGMIASSEVVIAAGPYSPALLEPVGIKLPIRPAKGYSVTYPDLARRVGLAIPIVDDEHHTVLVPIGDALRVAGTAEFAGFDRSIPAARVRNVEAMLEQVFPSLDITSLATSAWAGFRPMSYDGRPTISATKIRGLYVNAGHGHLGWTMAAGSGQLIADLIVGQNPEIGLSPFSANRFGRP